MLLSLRALTIVRSCNTAGIAVGNFGFSCDTGVSPVPTRERWREIRAISIPYDMHGRDARVTMEVVDHGPATPGFTIFIRVHSWLPSCA